MEHLLKTNIPLVMSEEDEKTFQEYKNYDLCKLIVSGSEKLRDLSS